MKMVFIAGMSGNMAKRYAAILKLMGVGVIGCDVGHKWGREKDADGFIIATPTQLHIANLEYYLEFGKPILVEKPVALNMDEITRFDAKQDPENLRLITMVNQYHYLYDPLMIGDTHYNYFKTGQDGLHWDCLNIIGAAKGRLELNNHSPIWQCMINGRVLNIAEMDHAYCNMIKDWVSGQFRSNWEYVKYAHLAVTKCLAQQS